MRLSHDLPLSGCIQRLTKLTERVRRRNEDQTVELVPRACLVQHRGNLLREVLFVGPVQISGPCGRCTASSSPATLHSPGEGSGARSISDSATPAISLPRNARCVGRSRSVAKESVGVGVDIVDSPAATAVVRHDLRQAPSEHLGVESSLEHTLARLAAFDDADQRSPSASANCGPAGISPREDTSH